MATYNTLTGLLTAIANAIRSKTGETGVINAQDFPNEIKSINSSYTITIYNGGNGNDFHDITIDTNTNLKKTITGDIRSANNNVEGSDDKVTWNNIPYDNFNNITYKYIKINKISSDLTDSYLTITQI